MVKCFEKSEDVFKAKMVLFFNDPLRDVDIDDLKNSIKFINEKVISEGLFPISINILVCCVGFVRKDIFNQINKIFENFSNENIAYTIPEQPIIEYNVSPFLSNYYLSKFL